jgi:beta-xylosidase
MKSVKQAAIFLTLLYCLAACKKNEPAAVIETPLTFCNPIDISYRFCLDEPSRREAADPSIVWFKDRYFLFASKSGGYWHSNDLVDWTFIETNEIPVEEYAPTAIAIQDTLYFLASSNEKSTLYKSSDPLRGKWSVAREQLDRPVWDPAFYLDDDKKLYLYMVLR